MAITIPTQAYADLTDLKELLPQRDFNSTTKPTDAQAEEHLKDAAAAMNGVLKRIGYAVPVTDTTAASVLRRMNVVGAAVRCEQARVAGAAVSVPDVVGMWASEWEKGLTDLARKRYALGDLAEPSTSSPEGQVELQSGGTDATPTFTDGMQF